MFKIKMNTIGLDRVLKNLKIFHLKSYKDKISVLSSNFSIVDDVHFPRCDIAHWETVGNYSVPRL